MIGSTLSQILLNNLNKYDDSIYTRYLVDGENQAEILTFSDLLLKSQNLAAQLQQKFPPFTRAILLFNSGLEFIIAFWACVLGGFIAVPVNSGRDERSLQRLNGLISDATPEILLTTQAYAQKISFPTDGIFLVDHRTNHAGPSFISPNLQPDDPVFLQYTSGSTGTPKGVIITHRNLIQNIKMIAKATSVRGCGTLKNEELVSWLPHYHDMGLIGTLITPALYHFTVTLMSPQIFIQRPVRWLKAISNYKATSSVAPNFGYSLCTKKIKEEELIGIDLQHWTLALNGAEPINTSTIDLFYQRFSSLGFQRAVIYPTYGLAEATLFVSGGTRENEAKQISKNNQNYISCGKPGLGLELSIIDLNTQAELPEESIGEIVIHGDNVTSGYWKNEKLNQNLFIAMRGKKFLKTGDLGFIQHDELYITGRLKDLIIIRGRNLYPHDIERLAEKSHAFIKEGSTAAFSISMHETEEVILLVEVQSNIKTNILLELKQVILSDVAKELGIQLLIQFVAKGSLFKTSSGKLQRFKCKSSYLNHEMSLVEN